MSSLPPSPKPARRSWLRPEEYVLILLTVASAGLNAWWVHHLGMTTALTDASAHLDFAKFLSQSITPGISQIGFWPPLLQIVLAPWVAIPYLFQTGLAGFYALIPFLCLGTVTLYRLVRNLTRSQALGITGAILFLANPYVLYYSSVPMMEMLYVSNLIVATYSLVRWLQDHEIRHLIWLGIFVTLTALSRYEGMLLIPLAGFIVLLDLYRRHVNRSQMEATLLLFGMLAIVSVVIILAYSYAFSPDGSPFYFNSGAYVRDPASNLGLTKLHPITTLKYLASASYYVISKPLTWLALASAILAPIAKRMRFERVAALLCLFSPMAFVFAALLAGNDSVLTPGNPYNFFHNDRYALTWIGFVVTSPLLLLSNVMAWHPRLRWSRQLGLGLVSAAVSVLVVFSGYRTYEVAYAQKFPAIQQNINGPLDPQRPDQVATADYLKDNYDFGYVLMYRSNEDPIVQSAGIPLNKYVYEANYQYYGQVTTDPEVFARWVVTTNLADGTDPVTSAVDKNDILGKYYTLKFTSPGTNGSKYVRKVYEINQTAALQEALDRGYNPAYMPSLTAQSGVWSTTDVYTQLASTYDRPNLAGDTVALSDALQTAYNQTLKPEIQKGPYVTASKTGSSEDQAYAMEEALDADDPATFATVWKWTQSHLQRSDYLFSWQFTQNADGSVTLDDPNSATSADTDIAVALLDAGKQWNNASYTAAGKQIVGSIWTVDTEYDAQGNRHVLAGNWGRLTAGFVTNAEAIDPAAYHLFATVDPAHNWDLVATTAYADLNSMSTPSITGDSQFMPINWAVINPATDAVAPYTAEAGYNDISYGSMRAIWYVSQDYREYKTPAALTYLNKLTAIQQNITNGKLCTVYIYSKPNTACYEDSASLAAPISLLQDTNQKLAQTLITDYAVPHQELNLPATDFFQQSWYWLALYGWSNR